MKISQFLLVTLVATTVLSGCKFKPVAAPDDALGVPVLEGDGTDQNEVRAYLSQDGKNVVVEIDELSVAAGGDEGFSTRKNLVMVVPVKVPEGRALAFKARKLSGSMDLSDKSSTGTLNVETFFAGQTGEPTKEELKGPVVQDFSVTPPMPTEVKFSACGQDVNMRMNLSLLVRSRNKETVSTVTLKSLGDDTGAFDIQWVKCK